MSEAGRRACGDGQPWQGGTQTGAPQAGAAGRRRMVAWAGAAGRRRMVAWAGAAGRWWAAGRRQWAARLLAGALLAAGLAGAGATPALAHAVGSGAQATNYRTRVLTIDPPTPA